MEIPAVPAGTGGQGSSALDPLSWQFNHLLVTPDFAAQYLAEAAVSKAPENAFRKKTARTISLYRPGAGPPPAAELTVLGDGTMARVKGPDISGVFDEAALKTIALELFRKGATSVP